MGRSFSIFFRHLLLFWGLCALAQIPGFVIKFMAGSQDPRQLASQWLPFVVGIVNMLFGFAIQGAVAYGVFEALRGESPRFGRSLSRGMSRVLPLLGASIAMGLCLGLIGLVFVFLIFFFWQLQNGIAILLFVIFAVLYSMLWCKWSIFLPTCVVERLGPLESLNRSSELTKGCRLKIAGLFLIAFLLLWILIVVAAYVTAPLLPYLVSFLREAAKDFVVSAFSSAFMSVMVAVLYYSLRDVKEGVSIESLAKVFD